MGPLLTSFKVLRVRDRGFIFIYYCHGEIYMSTKEGGMYEISRWQVRGKGKDGTQIPHLILLMTLSCSVKHYTNK